MGTALATLVTPFEPIPAALYGKRPERSRPAQPVQRQMKLASSQGTSAGLYLQAQVR
jgi:hypothetical protein